ncbi:hypothetical protein POVCU2_0035870 [Plasmodium ovale curtisi]|uniref:Uncharacterized protein n=1 Tax=Plasmodium ovale curtisi TaxID=864141 RepID=A0A1A8W4Y8_PLAOA|nr:hypothetical protein POVCU2_0035870 [Plasmodium ovale curtisi]
MTKGWNKVLDTWKKKKKLLHLKLMKNVPKLLPLAEKLRRNGKEEREEKKNVRNANFLKNGKIQLREWEKSKKKKKKKEIVRISCNFCTLLCRDDDGRKKEELHM